MVVPDSSQVDNSISNPVSNNQIVSLPNQESYRFNWVWVYTLYLTVSAIAFIGILFVLFVIMLTLHELFSCTSKPIVEIYDPVKKYKVTKIALKQTPVEIAPDEECIICFSTLEKDSIVVFNCNHKFCVYCIHKYSRRLPILERPDIRYLDCCICRCTVNTIEITGDSLYRRFYNKWHGNLCYPNCNQ